MAIQRQRDPLTALTMIIGAGSPIIVSLINRVFSPPYEAPKIDPSAEYAEYLDKKIEEYRRNGEKKREQNKGEDKEKSREESKDIVVRSNDYLRTAIDYLEKAKESNPCGMCKPKIEDAERYVENQTKGIIKAGEIYEKMGELQLLGAIAEKPWRELTEEEKNLVKKKVEDSV